MSTTTELMRVREERDGWRDHAEADCAALKRAWHQASAWEEVARRTPGDLGRSLLGPGMDPDTLLTCAQAVKAAITADLGDPDPTLAEVRAGLTDDSVSLPEYLDRLGQYASPEEANLAALGFPIATHADHEAATPRCRCGATLFAHIGKLPRGCARWRPQS